VNPISQIQLQQSFRKMWPNDVGLANERRIFMNGLFGLNEKYILLLTCSMMHGMCRS